MQSERVLRLIGVLLEDIEADIRRSDWSTVREHCESILALDPENENAKTYLSAAERRLGSGSETQVAAAIAAPAAPEAQRLPVRWFTRYRRELLFVALCTAAGAFLRIYHLAELPPGLHGDEALTGLEAINVQKLGWIGPYSLSGLGQPSGPLYFAALIFDLSGPTLFTVRLSMAILGIATIPAAYLLFRTAFGRWVALFGTAALVFSSWHLHYSRTAFMVISMPLMAALAAICLLWATRLMRPWQWLVAGVALGAGVYSYNSYPVFLVAVALWLTVQFVLRRREARDLLPRYGLLAAGAVLIALPLLQYILEHPDTYFSHFRQTSLLKDPAFEAALGTSDKLRFLGQHALDTVRLLARHPEIDSVDGMGGRGARDPILAMLSYAGLAVCLYRWRSPAHLLALVTVFAGFTATFLTSGHSGDLRRSLIAVPMVYGVAGVGLVALMDVVRRFWPSFDQRWAIGVGSAALLLAATLNVRYYFREFAGLERTHWIFVDDFVSSVRTAAAPPNPGPIYFYSPRWSYNYEPRQFLYPSMPGEDRSREFGTFSFDIEAPGPATFVLLPPYTSELPALAALHPGGQTTTVNDKDGKVRFTVYWLP